LDIVLFCVVSDVAVDFGKLLHQAGNDFLLRGLAVWGGGIHCWMGECK